MCTRQCAGRSGPPVLVGERRRKILVFLDGGTTTLELARILRARTDITVASNSVPIAVELANHPRLILTGGSVKESTLALVGPIAERSIEQMHVDIAFIGMNGVSATA